MAGFSWTTTPNELLMIWDALLAPVRVIVALWPGVAPESTFTVAERPSADTPEMVATDKLLDCQVGGFGPTSPGAPPASSGVAVTFFDCPGEREMLGI